MNADEEQEKEKRAGSFGAVAAAYAEHRPDYPEAAVRWALAPAGPDTSRLRVLDLGAGTGKLTALLAGLAGEIVAVEPDVAMLAELRRTLPGVRALPGTAESIPLPDASVDGVLCAQSMHWFDMSRALPEIARVLVPGGALAGLWNSDDDRVEWVAGLQRAAEGAASPSLSARRSDAVAADAITHGKDLFTSVEKADFPNGQRRTAESLAATVATHSRILIMPERERQQVLTQVRDYLASRPETSDGEFALPMVTSAVRARRR
jgi:ubiquinone/menaquinone biosynthesis C-methylase UbiE